MLQRSLDRVFDRSQHQQYFAHLLVSRLKIITLRTNKSSHNKTPHHIQILLSEKRKARAKWQKLKFPNDKFKLNQLSNQLKKATKSLLRLKQPSPPLRKADHSWAITDLEKVNIFAEHLSKCFTPHDIQPSASQLLIADSSLNSPLPMSLPAKNTSPGEIEHIIKQLPIKKSPGHDLISNVITKNLPKKVIVFLTHIFNAIFKLSYFPNTWKYSVVILIPKLNKPPQDLASYRPISLHPTFSKIFEKILLKRLTHFAS
ncbi:Hypothetical protein CINCED_3A007030 [Cinara cedri]|uniref:Reverse transcriptase domain n=1 Tax=Cinara cedri TaxID=506608 RepID=A0A5E4NCZ8_9HEMI|nr:Hypothetical protein CINCED_3A007030 [Cinara cedri]